MRQEPVQEPGQEPLGEYNKLQDMERWGNVLEALDTYSGPPTTTVPDEISSLIESIEDPDLRAQLGAHSATVLSARGARAAVTKYWDQLADTSAHRVALPGRLAGFAGDIGKMLLPEKAEEFLAGKERSDYQGSTEDWILDAMTAELASLIRAQSSLEQGPELEVLNQLDDKQLHSLVFEEFQRRFDQEADEMGFWGNAGYAALANSPELAIWLSTTGIAAGAVGGVARNKAAGLLGKLAFTAPRLHRAMSVGAGIAAAGATAGYLESVMPLTRDEQMRVEEARVTGGDPEQIEDEVRTHRLVHLMAMWPVYELMGAVGGRVSKSIRFAKGENAVLGQQAPRVWRMVADAAGGATTGAGFAMLPVFEAAVNPDQRRSAVDLVGMALDENVDREELYKAIKRFGAEAVGGSMVPFAALHVATGFKHAPGIPPGTRKMLDGIADRIIAEAPPWMKEQLAAERARAGEFNEALFRKLVADAVQADVTKLMQEGKSDLADVVGAAADTVHRLGVPEELVREETIRSVREVPGQGGIDLLETPELTAEEARLSELVERNRPLIDEVRSAVEKGEINWTNWQRGDIGRLFDTAFHKLFHRAANARARAVERAFYQSRGELMEQPRALPPAPPRELPSGTTPRGLPGPSEAPRAKEGEVFPMPGRVEPPQVDPPPEVWQGGKILLPGEIAPPEKKPPISSAFEVRPGGEFIRRAMRESDSTRMLAARERIEERQLQPDGDVRGTALFESSLGQSFVGEGRKAVLDGPEWDAAAAALIERFANRIARRGRGEAVTAAFLRDLRQVAEEPSLNPVGSPPELNAGQLLRRIVGDLADSKSGRRFARMMLDRNPAGFRDFLERENAAVTRWRRRAAAEGQKHVREQVLDKLADGVFKDLVGDIRSEKERKQARDKRDTMTLLERWQDMKAQGEAGKTSAKAAEQPKGKRAAEDGEKGKEEPKEEAKPDEKQADLEPSKEPTDDQKKRDDAEKITEEIARNSGIEPDALATLTSREGVHYTAFEISNGERYYMGTAEVSALHTDPRLQVREKTNEGRAREIAESWEKYKLEPVVVVWLETPEGKTGWYVIQGHHRYLAARMRNETVIPAVVWPTMSWDKALDVADTGNVNREGLKTLELAGAVARMSERHGGDLARTAREFTGRTVAWVQQQIDIHNLPSTVKDFAQRGAFGKDENIVTRTLGLLGEVHRQRPDINDGQLAGAAEAISRRKLYISAYGSQEFLRLYQATANRFNKAAEADDTGFLFDEMANAHREATEVIGEMTQIRMEANEQERKMRIAQKESRRLEESGKLTAKQRTANKEMEQVYAGEVAALRRRGDYLQMLLDRIASFAIDAVKGREMMEEKDDAVIRGWIERWAKEGTVFEEPPTAKKAEEPQKEPIPTTDELLEEETDDRAGTATPDAPRLPEEGGGVPDRRADAGRGDAAGRPGAGREAASGDRGGAAVPRTNEGWRVESDRVWRIDTGEGVEREQWRSFVEGERAKLEGAGWKYLAGAEGRQRFGSPWAALKEIAEISRKMDAEFRILPDDPFKPRGRSSVLFKRASEAKVPDVTNDPIMAKAFAEAKRALEQTAQRKVEEAGLPNEAARVTLRQRLGEVAANKDWARAAENPEELGIRGMKFIEDGHSVRVRFDDIEGYGSTREAAFRNWVESWASRPSAGDLFFSGLDPAVLRMMMTIGARLLDYGLTDPKYYSPAHWASAMIDRLQMFSADTGMDVEGMKRYLDTVWEKLRENTEHGERMAPWGEKDDSARGPIPKRRERTSRDQQAMPTDPAGGIDDSAPRRLTMEEQAEAVRREELDDVIAEMTGRLPETIVDEAIRDLPQATQLVSREFRNHLLRRQRFLADIFLTALTDGKRGAVLDMSGTGTGKTFVSLAIARELQKRNGGKILFVTANNAAVESWMLNDFRIMGLDTATVATAQDIKEKPDAKVILLPYHLFQTRHLPKIQSVLDGLKTGKVKTVIWDEAHRNRTHYKNTAQVLNTVQAMDDAALAGAKQIFATATPFAMPHEMRYLQPLGIWSNYYDFLRKLGYVVLSKGAGKGYRIQAPVTKEGFAHMLAHLVRVNRGLAERGQGYGFHLSYEGVVNHFVRVPVTADDRARFDAMAIGYQILEGAIMASGMRGLAGRSRAWRVNALRRITEEQSLRQAEDIAVRALEGGHRFLCLSDYKSEANIRKDYSKGGDVAEESDDASLDETGSLERLFTKPFGKDAKSVMERLLERGKEAVGILDRLRTIDQQVGTIAPSLEALHKRLTERGYHGKLIHGDISVKERVKIMQEWKTKGNKLDYILGTAMTLGESLSLQDTLGRPIVNYMLSIPWTAPDLVQRMGRLVRHGMVTTPLIVWPDHGNELSAINIGKVSTLLRALRATVHGDVRKGDELGALRDASAVVLTSEATMRPPEDAIFEEHEREGALWREKAQRHSPLSQSVEEIFGDEPPRGPEVAGEAKAVPRPEVRQDEPTPDDVQRTADAAAPPNRSDEAPAGGAPVDVWDAAAQAKAANDLVKILGDSSIPIEERQRRADAIRDRILANAARAAKKSDEQGASEYDAARAEYLRRRQEHHDYLAKQAQEYLSRAVEKFAPDFRTQFFGAKTPTEWLESIARSAKKDADRKIRTLREFSARAKDEATAEAFRLLIDAVTKRMEQKDLSFSPDASVMESGIRSILRSRAGSESGHLDLGAILAIPVAFSRFMAQTIKRAINPEENIYHRPEWAPRLDVARWQVHRWMRGTFGDPINVFGWRLVEPFLEAQKNADFEFIRDVEDFDRLWSSFERARGKKGADIDSMILAAALNGEHYDAELGPHQGRRGRAEEYERGERDDKVLGGRDVRDLPTYKEFVLSGGLGKEGRDIYIWMRDKYDALKRAHLANDRRVQHLTTKKSALMRAIQEHSGNPQRAKDVRDWIAQVRNLNKEIDEFVSEWGIEDYFNHVFLDRDNRRALPQYVSRYMTRQIRNDFLQKGRVSWETGWLDDVRQAFHLYYWGVQRKVHLDRALSQTERYIEGEEVPVDLWTLTPRIPIGFDAPQYDLKGREFGTLTARGRRNAEPMMLDHTRVYWNGAKWDAYRGEKESTTGEHRVVRLINVADGSKVELTKDLARKEYATARFGGLRSYGDKTPVMRQYERWMENTLGYREYRLVDKAIDSAIKALYTVILGGPELGVVQLNLLGGAFMSVMRYGPINTMRGVLLAASPTKHGREAREAAKRAGILTGSSLHFAKKRALHLMRGRHRGSAAPLWSAWSAATTAGHYAHTVYMAPFMLSESANRIAAFLTAYDVARRAGMDRQQSTMAGLRGVGETQFWYDGPNVAPISWSPAGRSLVQFSTYGLKFFNSWSVDLRNGVRGLRNALNGDRALLREQNSAGTLLRGATAAYLMTMAYGIASQAIQQYYLGDDDAEPLDISHAFGSRIRDAWGAEDWWVPAAQRLERRTGIDVTDAYLPGVMAPFGAPIVPRLGYHAVGWGWNFAVDNERGMNEHARETQRILTPRWIQKGLIMQDLGGEGSELDRKVEEIQEAVRMWAINVAGAEIKPFEGLPSAEDYRELEGFYDAERPYLVKSGDGRMLYRASGPQTQARLFLMGIDPRTRRSIDQSQEWAVDREDREGISSSLQDAYLEWLLDRRTKAEPEEALKERMEQMTAIAEENGVDFGPDVRRSWARNLPIEASPGGRRAVRSAADAVQSVEFLVQAAEAGTVTFAEFFDALQVMRRGENREFARWMTMDPDNKDRFQRALRSMGERRSKSTQEKQEQQP